MSNSIVQTVREVQRKDVVWTTENLFTLGLIPVSLLRGSLLKCLCP